MILLLLERVVNTLIQSRAGRGPCIGENITRVTFDTTVHCLVRY